MSAVLEVITLDSFTQKLIRTFAKDLKFQQVLR